ncbi:magnesium-transporting ATPase [Erysipelothrix larvae]|uniref:P-type Ca(2+) transporter n=1 Tax=Erysipelothrix larvae TaxID=1514105 RepID=A0A0X8H029_9FIRM|nr:cation-translocating P-type ATPase [Erysipelothrix larvae]AMC93609.1 magnesium-transporting ATPase [Erysipelothrix larvae]
MIWHNMTKDEVVKALSVDTENGLSRPEVDIRYEKYGPNAFEEAKKESLFSKILHHLKEISTIILLVAAGIAGYMAIYTGEGWAKVVVILSIVVINIVLGITQESRSEKALEALKNMNAHKASVIRNGAFITLDATEVVPGDIIELHTGDSIPADARLLEASSLQVEEAALTGESVPSEKDSHAIIDESAPIGDRINMVYSGCLVTGGRGRAVITETGMNTEMGKIANLLNTTGKQLTPLQKRLQTLAKYLSLVAIGAGVIIFFVGAVIHGDSVADMLLTAISLSVAAVPETLPVIVTLILANGVQNMVKKNTIVRRIPAVETVGNTNVICSDKTGTLTQNKMFIQRLWHAELEPNSASHTFDKKELEMLELLIACTNARVDTVNFSHDNPIIIGDPTEASIIRLMLDKGIERESIDEMYPRIHELPFDSSRKLMTTVHQLEHGFVSITKGAFDRIPANFTESLSAKAHEVHDSFANQALRVIAVGYRFWNHLPEHLDAETLENDLNFVGLIGMIDPPRPESSRAVAHAKEAGIKTVMITGDHIGTASAIAREIGILEEGGRAITGAQLLEMSDDELRNNVKDISVYARVSPEDKIRIVQAWQSHEMVIAMTGDGVNDAPALKAADVGAAMGITGTEVSKSASDMIITDDNFATIVDAISEGRAAYDNIRKTVHFLLSVNFAEIIVMLIGVLIGWGTPLTSVQLLFINVVSDGIPGFFISQEKAEKDVMQRKPLSKNASIFSNKLGIQIAMKSSVFIVITLIGFYIGRFVQLTDTTPATYATGITMAFIVLSWASVLNIFNVRTKQSLFKSSLFENPWLTVSAFASLLITVIVATVPFLQHVFVLSPISMYHWMIAIGLSLVQLVFGEIFKLLGY